MYDSRWQEDEVGCEWPLMLSTTAVDLCLSDIKCVIAILYWITSGPTKATAHPVKRSGALQQTTCALVAKAKRCHILSSNVNRCHQSKLEGGCSDCTQLMMLLLNDWRHTACKCTRQQQQQHCVLKCMFYQMKVGTVRCSRMAVVMPRSRMLGSRNFRVRFSEFRAFQWTRKLELGKFIEIQVNK